MGNTSSSHAAASGSPPRRTTSPSTPHSPTRGATPTPTQPIARPTSLTIVTGDGTGTGHATPTHGGIASTFHSGLTPPTLPPSPPPPSTPSLLPFGGHLSPQNPHALSHPQSHDYSKSVVTSLILEGRLAPFYRGLDDWEESYTEEDVSRLLDEVREQDFAEGINNSVTELMRADREVPTGMNSVAKKMGIHKHVRDRLQEERAERDQREKRAYFGATECPICFLNYPPNINTSRCCQQPICTECFVQIKRSEATITHLESEPACCPFCVETDFGVIYERPPDPILSSRSGSVLANSPEAGISGFSEALSSGSVDAELNVGPGMAPKAQEKMRRKSVSSKAKEVVTIDQIRPEWEIKLNNVKAAAARKASRRIVMRQVGDRLIPIGYTSSRATGQADFSMSIPHNGNADTEFGSRSGRRRASGRERDLEELMIMEAMRLSLLDHEEHQRNMMIGTTEDRRKNSVSSVGESSRRASEALSIRGQSSSAAHKILSKFGNRSRSGSSASAQHRVSFAPSGSTSRASISSASVSNFALVPSAPAGPSRNSPPAPAPVQAPSPVPALNPSATLPPPAEPWAPIHAPVPTSPAPRLPPSSLNIATAAPVAPVTTLDSVSAPSPTAGPRSAAHGLPRLSLDMPALAPDHKTAAPATRAPLERAETGLSVAPSVGTAAYAQLESDEE